MRPEHIGAGLPSAAPAAADLIRSMARALLSALGPANASQGDGQHQKCVDGDPEPGDES